MRMSAKTDFWVTAALFALALAVGGAGVAHPLLQMLLGFGSISAAAYFLLTERSWQFDRNRRLALALLALVLLLPLLQLVPLPPGAWRALSGRELPIQIDKALGWEVWRPLTLDVEATIRSFLRLLPAAVVFVGCLFLPTERLGRLLWLVVAFAVFSAVLGLAQLISGGGATPFPSTHSGYPLGLFVNRNHHAAMLLVAMPLAAAIGAVRLARAGPRLPIVIATIALLVLFAVVILGTTSRMALALLPIALGAALFTLFRARAGWRVAQPAILGVTAATLLLFWSGWTHRTLARFSSLDDPRFGYWSDVDWTLDRFALPGSGFGTFVPVYQMAESLEGLTPTVVNHAHNDYLEILLEGGIAGAGLVLLFFLLLGLAVFKLTRARPTPEQAIMEVAAAAGIALLLLFSVVDYPLRMPALAALFALLCALLLPPREVTREVAVVAGPRRWPVRLLRPVAGVVLAALTVLTVQAGLSSAHLLNGRSAAALKWAPWSSKAREQSATNALVAGELDRARSEGLAALRLSPISAAGTRSVGIVEDVRGNANVANSLMDAAAALGWHDPITQLWVIERTSRSGEPVKAVQRSAAMFRQGQFPPGALIVLLRAPNRAQSVAAMADALGKNPPWRRRFLALGGRIEARDAPAFEQLLGQLDGSGSGVSDGEVRPFVDAMIASRNYDPARRAWALSRDQQLVANGNFEAAKLYEGKPVPLGWELGRNDRGLPELGAAPKGERGRAVRIPASRRHRAIMWQEMLLTPGNYVLAFRVQTQRPQEVVVRWTLGCQGTGAAKSGEAALAQTSGWQDFSLFFAVPNRDCPVQRLVLRRSSGIHSPVIWIDDVRLNPGDR